MITGDLWTRVEWGMWWVWEPRLTTYFIMTLLVIALLRAAQLHRGRGAARDLRGGLRHHRVPRRADLLLHHALVTASIHPVVFGGGGGSWLARPMLVTFIIAQIGMLMLGYAIYQLRMREETAKERLEAVKASHWKARHDGQPRESIESHSTACRTWSPRTG